MTDLELISRYNALVEHDHTPAIERLDGDTWSIWDDQEGDVTMTTQEALKDWGEL